MNTALTIKKMLIYLCLFPCLLTGQNLYLTEALPVSTEGTSSRTPRIALLEDNRPVVYWGKTGANPTLYISVWKDGSFKDPVALNTNGIEPNLWGGGLGPQIAAQGNTIFLVFEKYGEGIYCIKSDDEGESFSNPVKADELPTGRFATLPSVAIDPSGNPIVSFITADAFEQDALYEITKSTDGGLSFPLPTVANMAADGGKVCECCPASIAAVSDDELYLGFRNNDNNVRDMWVSKSTDGGLNFTESVDIDDTDWVIQSCPQSGPDIMVSGDSIFSVFYSGADGSNIYFSSLNKETMTFGAQFQIPSISGDDQVQNFPSIAGSGDTLAVVWQESNSGFDVMMAWSVSGSGDLLKNTVVLADDFLSQKLPDIVYGNGRFYITYEDQLTSRVMYRIASFEEIVSTSNIEHPNFSVKISPNPSTGNTLILFDNENNDKVSVNLFNLNGQVLNNYETTASNLEISELEKGIYFIKIQKGVNVITEKLVVN
jgi:hypothetical protein